MPIFNYVDRHPQWTKDFDWYTATNESVHTHIVDINALLGDGKDHIASICSGGDLPIMMIPFTKQSMQVVDHAKKSMVWAMLKVLLLNNLGAERCKALMTGPWAAFDRQAKPLLSLLPSDIAACYYNASTKSFDKGWDGIQSVWKCLNVTDLALATHHLHKITFIHGDFVADLTPPEGGFDALYISNMFRHTDRNHKLPDANKIINMAKIGAPLIGTISSANTRTLRISPHYAVRRII